MERQQKIAFARILSDLIEADFIVEQGEMEYFEKIISRNKLNIKKTMLCEAKRLTLAKAIRVLKESDEATIDMAISILKDLSLSNMRSFGSHSNSCNNSRLKVWSRSYLC